MPRYLIFQLCGHLASWGDIAVGEDRPSWSRPSKSAVLGLLAAAAGIRRHEEAIHQAMADGYGMAVRVDSPGSLLRDYHTIQVPPQTALKGTHITTRRAELAALERYNRLSSKSVGTILSYREYRCDGAWAVAIWEREQAPYSLDDLAAALSEPKLTVYLGRKSCPPSLPLQPQVIDASSILSAFSAANLTGAAVLLGLPKQKIPDSLKHDKPTYYWDQDGAADGLREEQRLTRWDLPRSRARWQFANRPELTGPPEEEPSCS